MCVGLLGHLCALKDFMIDVCLLREYSIIDITCFYFSKCLMIINYMIICKFYFLKDFEFMMCVCLCNIDTNTYCSIFCRCLMTIILFLFVKDFILQGLHGCVCLGNKDIILY